MKFVLFVLALETVEYHHLRELNFIVHELTHIAVVIQERGGIEEGHHLVYDPVFGHGVEEGLQQPRAVVLHQHAVALMFLRERGEVFLREVGLAFKVLYGHVLHLEEVGVILLLALLADEHHSLFAALHARVFKRLLNEFCLARLQKAEEHINGNFFCHDTAPESELVRHYAATIALF